MSKTSVLAWVLAGGALIGSQPLAAQPAGGPPARFPTDVRTQDGGGNNLAHPEWGRAGAEFRRRTTVATRTAPAPRREPTGRAPARSATPWPPPPARALVGETFFVILRDQFERSRDGDRFWYESYLPRDLVQTVREQTLSRIIRRNTTIGTEVQPNVFLVRGVR